MPPLWTATTVPWTSIRSSLLNRTRSNPSLYQKADGVLHLFRQRRVVVALEPQGRPEPDAGRPGHGHLPGVVQDLVEPGDADRHHRDVQAGADHPDASPERVHRAIAGPPALREDEQGIALAEQRPDVAQRLARAGLPLRQR